MATSTCSPTARTAVQAAPAKTPTSQTGDLRREELERAVGGETDDEQREPVTALETTKKPRTSRPRRAEIHYENVYRRNLTCDLFTRSPPGR